jgi:predicted helicase
MSNIAKYIKAINSIYTTANATEHSYRGALSQLFIDLMDTTLKITNEPKRIACGAPDYVITKDNLSLGYIEAKDINDKDLRGEKSKGGNKEQFDRYKAALHNIIFTDYLEFHFYEYKAARTIIRIAEVKDGNIIACKENFEQFELLIADFLRNKFEPITSPERLAELMAGKALLMADIIRNSVTEDEAKEEKTDIQDQYHAFKGILLDAMTVAEFADMYAQTIAYGMFAARYQDTKDLNAVPKKFTRERAAALIPASNPFLRKLFQSIDVQDFDTRFIWIVDELANIFDLSIVANMLTEQGNSNEKEDPIIHFYETFLSQYNPALRKSRGVWYTPRPVVDFIVRAVDEILQKDFKLPDGLADTSKVLVKQYKDNVEIESKEYHKVQLLDPATGTGTFLVEVVKFLHKTMSNQAGAWANYVEHQLIPRLNGFELLMTSYAMAHLQLDILFGQTGYENKNNNRYHVYLTNSLNVPLAKQEYGGFASWLSREANEANAIKNKAPVMVLLGNPPYSGISSNNNAWISEKIDHYKYIDGVHFAERKHWLNNDYVKFIRMAQYYIEKLGEGIIAFINPHGFLDDPTSRAMRWNLLKAFDKIYVLDLHGNSKKKETAPDGSKDENVFDIMQGVSINIFVKTGKKKPDQLGKVLHYDLYGKRQLKYDFLTKNSIKSIAYTELKPESPMYFFLPKNTDNQAQYQDGFKIDELFPLNSTGIFTLGDSFIIHNNKQELQKRLDNFLSTDIDAKSLTTEYDLGKNYGEWAIGNKNKIRIQNDNFIKILYRPFDEKWTYFDNKLIWRWRFEVSKHFLPVNKGGNLGLTVGRQGQVVGAMAWNLCFISKYMTDLNLYYRGGNVIFPLYLYSEANTLLDEESRIPNLKPEIITAFAKKMGLVFTPEKEDDATTFAPIDILDYIYAVLHSPNYRERYKEFLKSDFPRVPYPQDSEEFWALVALGEQLRGLHLLETVSNRQLGGYPIAGNNIVEKIRYENNKVYINANQYFDNVPEVAWQFFIGGYQPAQKWLKDRKEQVLGFDNIQHYQKIIVALTQTDKIMAEIDDILFFA